MADISGDVPLPARAPVRAGAVSGRSYHALYIRYFPGLLAFILLGSYYVDVYFYNFYYREIAIGLIVLLLIFHLVFAPSDLMTNLKIAVIPLLLILYLMYFWAARFVAHTGAPILPSFAAARFWLYYLIAPNMYFAYKLGVPIRRLVDALIWSLIALTILGFIADVTLPLARIAASGQDAGDIIRVDNWRGVRLLLPYCALTFAFLTAVGTFFRQPFRFSYWKTAYLGLTTFLWVVTLPRVLNVSLLAALAFYFLALRGDRNKVLVTRVVFLMACIVGLVLFVTAFDRLYELTRYDNSFMTRENTLKMCLEEVTKFPYFGMGTASNFTINFQQIYGAHFVPSDVGIAGVLFQNGILGVALYGWISVLIVRAAFAMRNGIGDSEVDWVIGCCSIWSLTMIAASIPTTALSQLDGVPLAGYVLGMWLVLRERERQILRQRDSSTRRTPAFGRVASRPA